MDLFTSKRTQSIIHCTVGQGLFPNSMNLFMAMTRLLEDMIIWATQMFGDFIGIYNGYMDHSNGQLED